MTWPRGKRGGGGWPRVPLGLGFARGAGGGGGWPGARELLLFKKKSVSRAEKQKKNYLNELRKT